MQTVNSYLKNKKKKENTNRYKMKTVNEIAKANKIDLSNLEVKQDTSGLFQDSKGGFLKTVGGTLGDLASDIGEGFLRAVEGTTDWAQYRISDYEKWLSKQQKKAFDKLGMEKVGNKISGLSKTASEKLINNAKVDSTGALFGKNENQNLFKKGWTNKLEENSILGDTADTINQGIGQIGAMVGMSYLGGTVLGGTNAVSGTATALNRANKIRKTTSALTAYSSAYGNARSEAYKNGANDETANKTAMISGFSEAISEQFFDGIPGLKSQGWADNLTGKVAGSLEKSFGTKIGKTFMKVTDALGEGSEEIISNVLQATGNDIAHALDKNYNYGMENQTGNILKDSYNALTSEESLKSFFTAAMTSALVGGANTFLTTTQKNTIIKEYAKENDISFAEAKKQFETTINDETNAIAGNKSFNEKMDIQENIKRQELDNMKKGIFIEKGQRDQAFQYNETENEQVNNMLKSLSEKGNNTSENHATAKMAEKLIKDLGLNIEFTNSEELRAKGLPEADGYKEGNKLVLNLNSNKLTSYVMGHETTHFLENQGELYDAVSKAVFDLATTKGIHDGEVAKIKKLYANIIDNKVNEEMQNKGRALTEQEINKITDDIVRSELTANYVGEFFTDEEFFRTLGKENPSILQKLAEFFDELLSKITGNTERQQIHEAKRKIKKVYAEYMNGSQINLENSQEVQMKNKGITEQKQQDSINIHTKQETTQKQEINKSSEVNLPTAEKIENKNKENAQKNENTVKKIEKTDNETKTTEENIPTKTKIDNEEGIKKIKEKYDTTEKVTGSKKTIVLSNGEKLSGTYKLIEAGNVSASHNAETFEKTEGFPTTENGTTVNDRDYQSDKNAQNLVTQKSDNFDGRAFADNGVIVTKDGIVVSGNDRTMSGDLAAKKGTDTAYIEYLKDNASQFGFTVEQIDNMKHPRVVFELNKKLPYDTKTFAMFNKDAKKSKSVSERAKEIGKTIDEDTINSVSEIIDNFDTIDDLYNNEKATRELISLMQAKNIIDSNDLSDVYNGSKFTGSGKDLVESVILGSVINEDNAKYFSNNNDLKFKVMKAAPALIQNKTLNDYSINELFNNAVEVYKKASSSKMTLDEFTNQSNIFGDNDVDLVTKRIAQLLETKGYKNLRNFIEKYNAMAEFPASGQTDIFSGGQVETKEDILRKALNIDDNTEIQYLISDRQYNINDFARRFAKTNNYKNEISMDFISKVANAYAYGEYDPNYNYTNVDDIEDSKFANDLIEKIKFELDKKGYHLNELEDRFVKNDRQYMLSDTDNQGRKLTKEQQEYFKNSKVVDEKGNLLTVYRGEPTKGKTEYIAKKGGGNKENNEYGIYFTNSKDFAKDFAFERIQDPNDIFFVKKGKEGELKESYLNITNPLNLGTISREEISNLYDYASDMGKLDGKETFINNMLNWQRIGNHQLMKMNLDMKKIADNTIYDGLIAKLNVQGDEIEYAVFNSNQIKNVDNTKPTTNTDIRYMLSDDDLNKYIFDKDFYNQFQHENKEKITKSVEELQKELETIDESNDDGWAKGYNIRQDIKALKNGYDNQYDYIVSREKERLTEQYQRGQLDKKIQEKKNEEIKLKQLEEDIKNSSDFKNKQFEIIQKTNPAPDENHVWIRSPKDIKTWSEAMQDEESFAWGDFNYEDAEKALKTNRITVYSSYNIKNGTFVSTSYQQALDYAGGDRSRVHSKVVKTTNVAWINGDEGQYAKVDNQYMLKGDEMSGIYTSKNQFTNRLSDGLIQENLPTEEKTNLPTSNTNNEEENIFEKPTRRQVIDRNRQLAREQLGDITKIKDKKKGIYYQINTMKRNLRDIMSPEQAKSMYETYFIPITENNAKMEKDITSYNERIQKYNLNNEESVYTQMLGELRYNPDSELTSKEVNDYYNKNSKKIDADKVDKAIEEFRSIYDELIGRVNQTLTANGYKEIEYRQGYFPHFIEEKATSPIGKFAEKLGWKVKSGQLPTDIAGITDQFKPGKTWTTFSQHRTGDATDYNALKGLDNYLRGAMDVIHHTNDIQKLRALENEIRYQYSEKGIKEKIDSIYADDTLDMEEKNDAIYTLTNNMRNSGLGNFATEIRNYTDNLANKKAFGDRSMEQQFGRDTYSIMQNINSRVSANMVGGNISSALTNFIPITQAWSQLSTKNLMKGMYESIKASIKDDGFANNSVYLTNRTKQADRLYKSGLDKINDKLGIPFEAIDSFTSNTIVRAKYHDNIEKGMSEQEAIRNADEFAKDVMAGRSKGDMPTIMNQKNPLMKLMTAFQLEVNNQYGYMFKDIPADLGDEAKRKLVGAFIKMFFGAWLYNQLSEKITGRKSAFSPIDMAIDDIKTATNENLDLGDKISAIAKDTAQELPFVGGLLGGGRLPIQSAIPYENPLEMVTGTISDVSKTFDEDESKKKNAIKKLMKEWSKPVYYVAMPFGGGQIKKTIEGISMYNENLPVAGSYTDSGKLRFEAPDDTLGKLQAAVFGQYASKNAREYFDNGYQPLTEKQINTALDAGLNINEYREYNSGIKAQENNNDKINYINNLPLENEQKNVLANDVLKRKEKVDISDYGNYGSLEEFDYANKNPGKYNAITQITDYDSYNEYKKKINEIKDQYEDTNERKQAVFSYINSLELNKYQKLMLQKLASGYSIKNYKREMQNYINSLELSAAEKQQIDDALFK